MQKRSTPFRGASFHLSLTCGEEDKDNCDDDDPEPKVIAEASVTAAVGATAGAAVVAGVAERSVVVASHISYLLSVRILCDFGKVVNTETFAFVGVT